MKFFDKRAGCYRYKHKGSGVVRDTLMAIGKSFAKTATQSVKKAVENAAAQVAENVAAQAVEKGGKKIRQLLRTRRSRTTSSAPSVEMLKLSQIFSPEYTDMFRSPRYLEKVDYERFDLNTPLAPPGNGQHQTKTGLKFDVKDRDIIYDWCRSRKTTS